MSYAFSGKIAGLGRYRGLGDAAYDAAVAAYQADHARWLQEQAAYTTAYQAYVAQSNGAGQTYAMLLNSYNSDLASYNTELAATQAAIAARAHQQLVNQRSLDTQNAQARAAGAITPAGYTGCVTQAQHNGWVSDCSFQSQTVKGLGVVIPTGPACALALLPVCLPPLPPVAPLRPKPTPPPAPPKFSPPAPLRPEPQPPAAPAPAPTPAPAVPLTTAPQPSPASPSAPAPLSPAPLPAPTKSGGLISNGLLLVLLAGGGYALYRTLKKPKAPSN